MPRTSSCSGAANSLFTVDRNRSCYRNGRTYYAFDGKKLALPPAADERPSPDFLLWHNRNVFRG